ncbi:MAG TPA: PEP-CTERM sorting domain-containing protein [Phycisphaerales bacterium]|nr:PEP-CTERM sorting domain-containing protein [Phycisphaerales bacterium]
MKTEVMSNRRLAAYAAAGTAAAIAGAANADFTGAYDHANWTFITGSNASITIANATTLQITGANGGLADLATYSILAAAAGTVSFDWQYTSVDIGNCDYGGYFNTDGFTTLAANNSQGSGSASFNVAAGEEFGFWVFSVDGSFGPGVLTITNFSAPIPAPASLALLAAGAFGLVRRQRQA